ncbi:MAG: phage tail protein [Candidatus Thiodiazotropha sp.]
MVMSTRNRPQPRVPQPPHDPSWWHLDARTGWHAQQTEGLDRYRLGEMLTLALAPGSGRSLTDGLGSFGGLTLPSHLTWGPDWSLYLLEAGSGILKSFDRCACRFEAVDCLGGKGSGARNFTNPHGIAIRGDTLYVCDTGNRRIALISLRGYLLRSEWRPSLEAALDHPWSPYDLAFDRAGRLYVSDTANRCLHRFNSGGVWLGMVEGFNQPSEIAIDCQERLYVLEKGIKPHVVRTTLEGNSREILRSPAEAAEAFPELPVKVQAEGWLELGSLCNGKPAWFDPQGNARAQPPQVPAPAYLHQGIYLSEPLDSGIHQCQWHRVVVTGTVPAGSRVRLRTYSAEVPLPLSQIQALSEESWSSRHTLHDLRDSDWEGLITAPPGRYLWLSLVFESNAEATPSVEALRIEFPRISLRRYLPAIFAEDPAGADFTDRLLSLFDTPLRQIERRLDEQAALFDPMATPAAAGRGDFLGWLASWIGLELDRQWPEARRRSWLKNAAATLHQRGTRVGLHRKLLAYLGMQPESRCCAGSSPSTSCRPARGRCPSTSPPLCYWQPPPLILEHYQLRRWLYLDKGRLGDQAVLWGRRIVNRSQLDQGAQVSGSQLITTQDPLRDPFHVYAHRFSVFVPACYGRSESLRRALEQLIETEKPAHTRYEMIYVEPRFRIGFQSSIGLDAVVGRYPQGVRLGDGPLGRATVLDSPPHKRGGPSMAVGVEARVGGSTQLN